MPCRRRRLKRRGRRPPKSLKAGQDLCQRAGRAAPVAPFAQRPVAWPGKGRQLPPPRGRTGYELLLRRKVVTWKPSKLIILI